MDIYEILDKYKTPVLIKVAEELNDPKGIIPLESVTREIAGKIFDKEPADTRLVECIAIGVPLSKVLAQRLQ